MHARERVREGGKERKRRMGGEGRRGMHTMRVGKERADQGKTESLEYALTSQNFH
jgi:hypothetical protein